MMIVTLEISLPMQSHGFKRDYFLGFTFHVGDFKFVP